jgi:hypothetical protein
MDVRVMQDDTDLYKKLVMDGWTKFMREMKKDQMDEKFTNHMIKEGEYWQRRIHALDSGQLRVMRIHVILPKSRAMNDSLNTPA